MIISQSNFFDILKKYRWVILGLVVFLLLRLPGIFLPYHQDEWKNVVAAHDPNSGPYWAHPPLFQILFRIADAIVGTDYFRIFPILFSVGSVILLFVIVKNRFDKRTAYWTSFFFTICFYGVLGSLVPDVDGAIVPFFFLLSVYFYDRLNTSPLGSEKWRWLIFLTISLLLGFLIKLNFILVIGALILDYLWGNWKKFTSKSFGYSAVGLIGFGVLYIALLYIIQAIYPSFSIGGMLGHANQFTGSGRNWLQIAVQGIKAVYYLSPILIIPLLFISKEIFNKARIFFIYLVVGLFFYFVMFDFSRGALDKYLMFVIVPLAVISGVVISGIFESSKNRAKGFLDVVKSMKRPLLVSLALVILLIALNFLPQSVIGLYPKTEWFSRVLHGQWNMLNPFTGGSGPMGFYVSFLFIAVSYIVSIIVGTIGIFKKEWRCSIVIILMIIGIAYNAVFIEEFFFGKINGDAPQVLQNAVAFIKKTESIKHVMTYNDIGNQYLSEIGKYGGRIYATPESESGYKKKFSEFDGQYMVIDIPHLYDGGFYGKFFARCDVLYETFSGKITGRVYDCPHSQELIDRIK